MDLGLLLATSAAAWLIAVWFLVLGGVVGSFLNVVVYRLPQGLSLVRPGSHCPHCRHAIRWHDNVPVLGWLWLQGRCRDCHTPISPRYPLVEAIAAAMFLAVALVDFVHGLAPAASDAVDDLPSAIELAAMTGYHLLLLSTLLPAALIAWDGNRVPPKLYLPALAVGVALPLAYSPALRPLVAYGGSNVWIDTLCGAGAGLAGGLLLACSRHTPCAVRSLQSTDGTRGAEGTDGLVLCLAGGSIGVFLGWQAAVGVCLSAGLFALVGRIVGSTHRAFAPPVGLFLFTLGWILAWHWLPL